MTDAKSILYLLYFKCSIKALKPWSNHDPSYARSSGNPRSCNFCRYNLQAEV